MGIENIRRLLWEKANEEQRKYIEELKNMTPDKIIEHSYETIMREDILMSLEYECENERLTDNQVRELLNLECPISACYNSWMDSDVTYMDIIHDCIDDYSKELVDKHEENNIVKKKYEPER